MGLYNVTPTSTGYIPYRNGMDLVETTMNEVSPDIFDNVTKHIPFLKRLRTGQHIKFAGGGLNIEEDLMYAENTTFQYFRGTDQLIIKVDNILMPAIYEWKLANATVVITQEELWKNASGKTRKHELLATRILNCTRTFENRIGRDLWAPVVADKQLQSVPTMISDNPAMDIVGGIDRSKTENAWWRNQTFNFFADMHVTQGTLPTGQQLYDAINEMHLRTTRGGDQPTVIFASKDLYLVYKNFVQSIKRITNENGTGDPSFRSLEYENMHVIYDPFIPPMHMYFLNEKYFHFVIHRNANFVLDKKRIPPDMLVEIYPMLLMGALTCSNMSLQGVIYQEPAQPSQN